MLWPTGGHATPDVGQHMNTGSEQERVMGINALTMQMLRAYDRRGRNAESHAWRGGLLRWSRRRKQEN